MIWRHRVTAIWDSFLSLALSSGIILAAAAAPSAPIIDALAHFAGVALAGEPGDQLKSVPGPLVGMTGVRGQDIVLSPTEDCSSRGTVSFWLQTEQTYQIGPGNRESRHLILSSPGVFALSLLITASDISLDWKWETSADVRNSRVLLPGLPGPAWYHLAYAWDASSGTFNAFLNGTPLQGIDAPPSQPWLASPMRILHFHLGTFALSGLRVRNKMLEREEIKREVSSLYLGSLDQLLGARELGRSNQVPRGKLLYENSLSGIAEGWFMEGPGQVEHSDGWMRMFSQRSSGPNGHFVYWCPQDLPDSYFAEWEIQLLSENGLCIVFFSAQGRDGRDILDPALAPREGIFTRYHSGDIDCYHISYYANNTNAPSRITSNLRKNCGFYLAANGPPGIPPRSREIHSVQLRKDGDHIVLAVDGRTVIDHFDDGRALGPVLRGGKIGFRQMQAGQAQYRNFKLFQLVNETEQRNTVEQPFHFEASSRPPSNPTVHRP
jgi:hypothetical protein